MGKTRKAISGLGFLAAFLVVGLAQAAPFRVNVYTPGTPVQVVMAFDLNNGDPKESHYVTITNFDTDGTLLVCPSPTTPSPCTAPSFVATSPEIFPAGANITGTLPAKIVIYDTDVEVDGTPIALSPITYYQNIVLGSYLSFDFEMFGAPGSMGNGLTFWFLDPTSKSPGSPFQDGPYNNYLFLYTFGADPTCDLADPAVPGVTCTEVQGGNGVPEPSALALALAGLLGIGFARSRRVGRVSVSALQG